MTTATKSGFEALRERAGTLTKQRTKICDAINSLRRRKGVRDPKTGIVKWQDGPTKEAVREASLALYGEEILVDETNATAMLGAQAKEIDRELTPLTRLSERAVGASPKQKLVFDEVADMLLAGEPIGFQSLLTRCRDNDVQASAIEIQTVMSLIGRLHSNI